MIDEVLDKLCNTEMAHSVLFPPTVLNQLGLLGGGWVAERNELHRETLRSEVVEFSGRIRTESIFEATIVSSSSNAFLYCVASPSTGTSVGTVQLEAHFALRKIDQIHLMMDTISGSGLHHTGINCLSCSGGCYSISNLKDVEKVTGEIMATSCLCLTV